MATTQRDVQMAEVYVERHRRLTVEVAREMNMRWLERLANDGDKAAQAAIDAIKGEGK